MGLLIRAPEWVLWSLGSAAGVAGLLTVLWALAWDRAKGRRRCGRCWYDMAGTPGLRCPECGREARSERALMRTRRRWMAATLGAMSLGLGSSLAAWPTVREHGAMGLLPNFVLVRMAPAIGQERHWDKALGDWVDSPVCMELERRANANELSPSDWLTALQTSGALKCRKKWPKDRPLVVGLTMPRWAGQGMLELKPRTPGLVQAVAYRQTEACMDPNWDTEGTRQTLGVLAPGTNSVVFDATLSRMKNSMSFPANMRTAPTLIELEGWTLPIELVDSIQEVIPGAADWMEPGGTLQISRRWWKENGKVVSGAPIDFEVARPLPTAGPSARVGFAFVAELLHEGKVLESRPIVLTEMLRADGTLELRSAIRFQAAQTELWNMKDAGDPDARNWSIRLTPDGHGLLERWGVDFVSMRAHESTVFQALGNATDR